MKGQNTDLQSNLDALQASKNNDNFTKASQLFIEKWEKVNLE